jgi:hypothetical protein
MKVRVRFPQALDPLGQQSTAYTICEILYLWKSRDKTRTQVCEGLHGCTYHNRQLTFIFCNNQLFFYKSINLILILLEGNLLYNKSIEPTLTSGKTMSDFKLNRMIYETLCFERKTSIVGLVLLLEHVFNHVGNWIKTNENQLWINARAPRSTAHGKHGDCCL